MVAAKWWLLSQLKSKLFNDKPILGFGAASLTFIFVVQYILAYPALDYPAPRLTGRVQQADTFYIIM